MSIRVILVSVALVAAPAWPSAVSAAVIHLVNGSQLTAESWHDAGDAIEFLSGGGIIRIAKSEVRKIDGKPSRGDFRMSTSGTSSSESGSTGEEADAGTVASVIADLLGEGEAIFAQGGLTTNEKAVAFRRLGERLREFEVPEPLRAAYGRGQQAIQLAADAHQAESQSPGEQAPDVLAKMQKAKTELRGAQDDFKKLSPGKKDEPKG